MQRSQFLTWTVPVVFSAVICFSHIHQGTIAVDAIRYSAIAKHILTTGDWVHLYDPFTQSAYANKPPLLFWTLATVFDSLGFSTFLAKLPAVLFTFAAMLICYHLAVRMAGVVGGLWALFLFAANRSFFRDLVELGFDGMAICGAFICFWALSRYFEREGVGARTQWLQLACGVFLILQSKPPYLLLVGFPMLVSVMTSRHARDVFRSPGFYAALFTPILLMGAWFLMSGSTYLQHAVDNQFAEPLRQTISPIENLSLWLKSFIVDFAPLSVVAVWVLACNVKSGRAREHLKNPRMVLWYSLLFLLVPIVLLVAQRARYLWLPMLGALMLSAEYLATQVTRVSEVLLRRFLVLTAVVICALVVLFNVRMHRSNPLIEFLSSYPEYRSAEVLVCVNGDRAYRDKRMARYSQLLLDLEFASAQRVLTSSELLLEPAASTGASVLAERHCLARLEEQSVNFSKRKEARRAALISLQ